ncbi:MAG TPA: hypothetical protein VEJ45_03125 [Candidatus Acidoferrales bacterium]|nr:hypothetical protein [Candidatus Acidoferrales bacterium]
MQRTDPPEELYADKTIEHKQARGPSPTGKAHPAVVGPDKNQ